MVQGKPGLINTQSEIQASNDENEDNILYGSSDRDKITMSPLKLSKDSTKYE